MRIAVAGATGRVGAHVVEVLEARGHEVVPISRGHGVDVITGDGLESAMAGVDVIVDTATSPSADKQEATEFFTTASRNLQSAGERAGVRHIVLVSIIGIEQFQGGYNAAKLAHEQAMLAGPLPVRILRAAQFHELVGQLVDWGTRGDVAYVPHMRTQLVAARTVAEALADLAEGPATGPVVEIAGPRAEDLVAMATLLAGKRGAPAKVEGLHNPDDPDAVLMETGALLPGPGATLAGPTFEQWFGGDH
jgi:uncharacterized protein YbjT (DUF2867 family)